MKCVTWKPLFVLLAFMMSVVIACDEESKPGEESQDAPESVEFRMSDSSSPAIEQASSELSTDTMLMRTPSGKPARFGVESGRITFKYTGARMGKQTITFKDYGLYERRSDSSMPSQPDVPGPVENSMFIVHPDSDVTIDLNTGQGWRIKSSVEEYLNSDSSSTMSIGEYYLHRANPTFLADTTINGYQCKTARFESPGLVNTLWIWRGIVLRQHFFAPLENVEFWLEPVSIEVDVAVEDSEFDIPDGFTIQDRTEPPIQSAIPLPAPEEQPSEGN